MNKSKRLEILETLVAEHDEYDFDDFYMRLDAETGIWRAEEADSDIHGNHRVLCRCDDVAECYDASMRLIRSSKMTAESLYTTKLENVVKKLASTEEALSFVKQQSLIKSAQRALKAKPKES